MYRRSQLTNFEFVQACTLHLLDMHWQKYDLPFLVEVNLPQFYIDLAKCELRLCACLAILLPVVTRVL